MHSELFYNYKTHTFRCRMQRRLLFEGDLIYRAIVHATV